MPPFPPGCVQLSRFDRQPRSNVLSQLNQRTSHICQFGDSTFTENPLPLRPSNPGRIMRLLELNNDGEFSLTQDIIDNIPRYAILSHTWGAEEVTFRDMIDGTGKSKAGYDKIRFCGEQARRHSWQYFWVDTCCIDKSNNNELSEAINSMFRWYRNAAKCYVYLSDVPRTAFNTDNESYQLP
jgi:hypothetical protein